MLASPPSAVEQRAGIAKFQRFKYINTINALSGGDIIKWDVILNLPYDRVLTKLLLNKTEAEYQGRYGELLNPS